MTRNELWWKQQETKENYEKIKRHLKKLTNDFDRLESKPFFKFDEYLESVSSYSNLLRKLYIDLKKLDMIECELDEFEQGSITEKEYKELASYLWEYGTYPED